MIDAAGVRRLTSVAGRLCIVAIPVPSLVPGKCRPHSFLPGLAEQLLACAWESLSIGVEILHAETQNRTLLPPEDAMGFFSSWGMSAEGRSLILGLAGAIVDHDNASTYDRLIDLLNTRPTRDELAATIASSGVGTASGGGKAIRLAV